VTQPSGDPQNGPPRQESYTVGYGLAIQQWHLQRSAANRAAFLLPHLRPGIRLLDCGCGPGSITLGLAEAVAPGPAIGIDVEPRQVERASALAAQRGVANAHFQAASIYDLPFTAATFDAAFAHNVLEHLRDPLRALREMRRVLKPGGIIGVRDPDLRADFFVPPLSLVEAASRLLLRVRELKGGNPYYARHQRRLLREAGFVRVEALAYAEHQGNATATADFAEALIEVLQRPETVRVALAQGWADEALLAEMAVALRAWAEDPAALHVVVDCAALGWVEG
jgi:SAM-dependent methyltransferase